MRIRVWAVGLTAALALAPAAAQAQDFGIIGGALLAKFGGSNSSSINEDRVGLAAGLFAHFHFGNNAGIEVDAMYARKGSKTNFNNGGDISVRLSYLEVPVLLKLRFAGGGKIKPNVLVGPAFDYKLKCTASNGPLSVECNDLGFNARDLDISAMFGAGVEIGHLGISLRYGLGLTKIDTSGGGGTPSADLKNRAWYLLGSWAFKTAN